MKYALILASLFLFGCPKTPVRTHPLIETNPPQYLWVCQDHSGTIVCDAVPTLKDVPVDFECTYQTNGITACWPVQKVNN